MLSGIFVPEICKTFWLFVIKSSHVYVPVQNSSGGTRDVM